MLVIEHAVRACARCTAGQIALRTAGQSAPCADGQRTLCAAGATRLELRQEGEEAGEPVEEDEDAGIDASDEDAVDEGVPPPVEQLAPGTDASKSKTKKELKAAVRMLHPSVPQLCLVS